MMLSPSSFQRTNRRPRLIASLCAAIAVFVGVSTASAHDFWVIPDMFAFASDATVHVSGRSGTRFPAGSAVQPARVADARIIGAATETKITDMAVEGNSLRLHQKPAAPGQYRIAVALTPRTTRSTPAALLRFLRGEGGAAEADRLERENALGSDSIAYQSASYAATVVQVGNGGPRAFAKTAGFPLEFVPVNDPAQLHVGDTLHVKIIGGGKPVPNASIDAGPAADTTAAAAPSAAPGDPMLQLIADASGVAHLPVTKAGAWFLRGAYVSRKTGGAANEWDVARSTYTFGVSGRK